MVIILRCIGLNPLSQKDLYYYPQNILRFADNLYEEGDFLRAATEYKRYLTSLFPKVDESGRILFRIASCFNHGGKMDLALNYYQKIVQELPNSGLHPEAILLSGYSSFSLGQYDKAISYLSHETSAEGKSPEFHGKRVALIGASLLMKSRWKEASDYLDSFHASEVSSLTEPLKILALKGTHLSKKNPLIAGLLSAAIPGLGRIYAKRTVDGLYSFITIGLSGWQAYDGFRKKGLSSFKGWAFGIVGALLYAGNIYGSAVAIQIYNAKHKENIFEEVRLLISARF